jgi:hypothetical protein
MDPITFISLCEQINFQICEIPAEKLKTEGGGSFNPRAKPTNSEPALTAEGVFF